MFFLCNEFRVISRRPGNAQKNSQNRGNLIDLDLLLPKTPNNCPTTLPPWNVAGLWLWAKPKNFWYYPPPLNQAYGDPGKFLLLPPPPLNLVGLRRSRKIGPPKKKSWLRRCGQLPRLATQQHSVKCQSVSAVVVLRTLVFGASNHDVTVHVSRD